MNINLLEEETGFGFMRVLGSGSFATVYLCNSETHKQPFAMKVIQKQNLSIGKLKAFRKEAEILRSIDHKNVVKFLEFKETENNLYLQMQYVKGGTVRQIFEERWKNGGKFQEFEISAFIKSLLQGIKYLHHFNIIHRDLKLENILLVERADLSSVKIVDFGLSAKLDHHSPTNIKSQCGTLLFMAPEIIHKPSYTKSVDVWSVSIIMYMMITNGKHPFYEKGMTNQEYKFRVNSQKFPKVEGIGPMTANFLEKISKLEYNQRYSVNEALKHPFITRNFEDQIPLSIHQSFKSFDSTNQINTILHAIITLASCIPHQSSQIPLSYRNKVYKFSDSNESIRVSSPSRKRMRDKNTQLFVKMKQILNDSYSMRNTALSQTISIIDSEDLSPTLKKHETFYLSLFEKQKDKSDKNSSIGSSPDKNTETIKDQTDLQDRQIIKLLQIQKDPLIELHTSKADFGQISKEGFDGQQLKKIELTIINSVSAYKSRNTIMNPRKIFKKKSFLEPATTRADNFAKKYSLADQKLNLIYPTSATYQRGTSCSSAKAIQKVGAPSQKFRDRVMTYRK